LNAARVFILAAALALVAPAGAAAQVFFASRPHPEFEVGPVTVRANLTPALDTAAIAISFRLALPPTVSGGAIEQDLALLWPGTISSQVPDARPDRELAKFIEARGYVVVAQGAVQLLTRDIYRGRNSERQVAVAPYVTFHRERSESGPTLPATWIRIPWRPELVDASKIVRLAFTSAELVRPQRASWIEEAFRGVRHQVTLSFNDVRARGMFPLYLEHRDRVIRLAEDPSQLSIAFRTPQRLKIESVAPPTATRRQTETRDPSHVVTIFLDRAQGLAPQVLSVEFGYFSGLQAWMPILVPILFFLLGNLAAVLVRVLAEQLRHRLSGRFTFGASRARPDRETGVIVPREKLTKIAPGETTYDEVIASLGPTVEEHERLDGSSRRTLVYRGRRLVPRQRRSFGWVSTISHWDVEDHEVEILVEGDRVQDVQARIHRARRDTPNGAPVPR